MEFNGSDIIISANGNAVSYDDYGKGTPVIFIHGFPFDKSMWKPQLDFMKSTHRVIAYDLRGYGKSERGEEELSIDLFADDLVDLLDALQIDKVIACGLSMGGYILLNAINRFPNRFPAIILADTQCIGDSPETKEKRKNSIRQIQETGVKEFSIPFIKNVFHKESLENKKEAVSNIENIILSSSPETITGTLQALAERSEKCLTLGEITVPTLVVCGKDDVITPLAQSERLHKDISQSVLKIIEGAGHMSNLEQPDIFNGHLFDFLRGNDL